MQSQQLKLLSLSLYISIEACFCYNAVGLLRSSPVQTLSRTSSFCSKPLSSILALQRRPPLLKRRSLAFAPVPINAVLAIGTTFDTVDDESEIVEGNFVGMKHIRIDDDKFREQSLHMRILFLEIWACCRSYVKRFLI